MIFYVASFDLLHVVKNLGFLIMAIASGCQSFREQPVFSAFQEAPPGIVSLDTTLLQREALHCGSAVRSFYLSRDFSLFWRDRPLADSLIAVVSQANALGLLPEDYHLEELGRHSSDTLTSEGISRRDVLLTDAFLSLYHHLRHGRLNPETLQRRDMSFIVDAEALACLENVSIHSLRQGLVSGEPQIMPYQLLKRALGLYPLPGHDDETQEMFRKISLNMERWRWQEPWPDRYVFVNIPAFSLRVVEKDSVWLQSRVIVGKRETPTPVLESVIRSFIIYPYWHVPYSISTKEILPALQADRSYLGRNNFEVLDKRGNVILADTIQWDFYDHDNFPFTLRQREGSENSMGIIKFNFANRHNVYLHDTNSRRLFNSKMRDRSHGCVRVEQAVPLAHYLVREDDIYVSPEDLDQYLSLQQRLKIDLRKPIPLKLEYFTAEVVNGVAVVYEDIYKQDSVMVQSLYNPGNAPATGPDTTTF